MRAISPQLHGKGSSGENRVQVVWSTAGLRLKYIFQWKQKISFEMFVMNYWGTPYFLLFLFQASWMKLSWTAFCLLSSPIFIAFPKPPPNSFLLWSTQQMDREIHNKSCSAAQDLGGCDGQTPVRQHRQMKSLDETFPFSAFLEVLAV